MIKMFSSDKPVATSLKQVVLYVFFQQADGQAVLGNGARLNPHPFHQRQKNRGGPTPLLHLSDDAPSQSEVAFLVFYLQIEIECNPFRRVDRNQGDPVEADSQAVNPIADPTTGRVEKIKLDGIRQLAKRTGLLPLLHSTPGIGFLLHFHENRTRTSVFSQPQLKSMPPFVVMHQIQTMISVIEIE